MIRVRPGSRPPRLQLTAPDPAGGSFVSLMADSSQRPSPRPALTSSPNFPSQGRTSTASATSNSHCRTFRDAASSSAHSTGCAAARRDTSPHTHHCRGPRSSGSSARSRSNGRDDLICRVGDHPQLRASTEHGAARRIQLSRSGFSASSGLSAQKRQSPQDKRQVQTVILKFKRPDVTHAALRSSDAALIARGAREAAAAR